MSFRNVSDVPEEKRDGYVQGRVVDNKDPLMKQRVKVAVPNFMEGPPDMLPWIGPIVQSKFGMTETAVSVNVPVIGSIVAIQFQEGDLHYGVLPGSLHTELSAELGVLATNYPERRGWLDPRANWSYIDITPGMVEFQLHHKSGTQYTTFDDGRVHHLAVNLYFIEAPDIKEEAYNSHVVISTTSTHDASFSHTTTSPSITANCTTHTINAAATITHRSVGISKLQSVIETEVSSVEHVLITAGRIDLNP